MAEEDEDDFKGLYDDAPEGTPPGPPPLQQGTAFQHDIRMVPPAEDEDDDLQLYDDAPTVHHMQMDAAGQHSGKAALQRPSGAVQQGLPPGLVEPPHINGGPGPGEAFPGISLAAAPRPALVNHQQPSLQHSNLHVGSKAVHNSDGVDDDLYNDDSLAPRASNLPAQPRYAAENDDDDDFDVQLDDPADIAKVNEATAHKQDDDDDDDDFDVQLDDQERGRPSEQQQRQMALQSAAAAAYTPQVSHTPGSLTGPAGPKGPAIPGLSPLAAGGIPGLPGAPPGPPAGPRPPFGGPRPLPPPPSIGHVVRPKYINVHTGAFVVPAGMNRTEAEEQAVWPTEAAANPDKLIKLPGQTKVGEEEYKEFLSLGHGGVFDLELKRVLDAPWAHPSADLTQFFNYGLTPHTWSQYQARVQQYRVEYMMQHKIPVLRDERDRLTDVCLVAPNFPCALAKALEAAQHKRNKGLEASARKEAEQAFQALLAGAYMARPPPHQDCRRAAPGAGWDDIIVLLGPKPQPPAKPVAKPPTNPPAKPPATVAPQVAPKHATPQPVPLPRPPPARPPGAPPAPAAAAAGVPRMATLGNVPALAPGVGRGNGPPQPTAPQPPPRRPAPPAGRPPSALGVPGPAPPPAKGPTGDGNLKGPPAGLLARPPGPRPPTGPRPPPRPPPGAPPAQAHTGRAAADTAAAPTHSFANGDSSKRSASAAGFADMALPPPFLQQGVPGSLLRMPAGQPRGATRSQGVPGALLGMPPIMSGGLLPMPFMMMTQQDEDDDLDALGERDRNGDDDDVGFSKSVMGDSIGGMGGSSTGAGMLAMGMDMDVAPKGQTRDMLQNVDNVWQEHRHEPFGGAPGAPSGRGLPGHRRAMDWEEDSEGFRDRGRPFAGAAVHRQQSRSPDRYRGQRRPRDSYTPPRRRRLSGSPPGRRNRRLSPQAMSPPRKRSRAQQDNARRDRAGADDGEADDLDGGSVHADEPIVRPSRVRAFDSGARRALASERRGSSRERRGASRERSRRRSRSRSRARHRSRSRGRDRR